jgi:hypothetical protein
LGVALATPRLRALARRMDHTEYGGAPLLGVNGVCIIAHGSSKAKAIRNSVAVAVESVRAGMVETIRADIGRLSSLPSVAPSGDDLPDASSPGSGVPAAGLAEAPSGTERGAGLPLSHGSSAES